MPKLAAFPKAYMTALCKDGTMSISEWIDIAAGLDLDGVEWYAGFLEMENQNQWGSLRRLARRHGDARLAIQRVLRPDEHGPGLDHEGGDGERQLLRRHPITPSNRVGRRSEGGRRFRPPRDPAAGADLRQHDRDPRDEALIADPRTTAVASKPDRDSVAPGCEVAPG